MYSVQQEPCACWWCGVGVCVGGPQHLQWCASLCLIVCLGVLSERLRPVAVWYVHRALGLTRAEGCSVAVAVHGDAGCLCSHLI